MGRYLGPKNKLARRIGSDLGLKTVQSKAWQNLQRKLNIPPGQHGGRRRRKFSEFGIQLSEKQKIRYTYQISEGKLRNYAEKAKRKVGQSGEILISLLERRLDNIVYRLGFASTRPAARQLVSHNHVSVNGKTVNIASFLVKVGDIINLSMKAVNIPQVTKVLSDKNYKVGSWLEKKATTGKILRLPEFADINPDFNMQSIIEFYSR